MPTMSGLWQRSAYVSLLPVARSTKEVTHVGNWEPAQSASVLHNGASPRQPVTALPAHSVDPSGVCRQIAQMSEQASAQARHWPLWQLGVSPRGQTPHCSVLSQPSGAGPQVAPSSWQVLGSQASHCWSEQIAASPQTWQAAPPLPHAALAVPGWQTPSGVQQPLGHVCGVQGLTHWPFSQRNAPSHVPQLPPQPSGPQTLPAQSGAQHGATQNGLPLPPHGPATKPMLSTQAPPGPQSASLPHPFGSRMVTVPPQMARPVCETKQ